MNKFSVSFVLLVTLYILKLNIAFIQSNSNYYFITTKIWKILKSRIVEYGMILDTLLYY